MLRIYDRDAMYSWSHGNYKIFNGYCSSLRMLQNVLQNNPVYKLFIRLFLYFMIEFLIVKSSLSELLVIIV